ncbi:aspartate ammonia-lyase [Clostridium acetobutylicum EA 2018]|uniref:aspartate ammonia-lyase n=1 Tax=Clostridium acetobutylicum TaxID=1488 RepID=UPI000200A6FE|nr:aspartate ammonia-lyase [Clostridium acetobutylicum]ADZ19321.1 aspartate ammonia-lyase [Clostridium acetobutylicum EA 2018]
MDFRIESDSIGDKKVPKEVYYGVQTLRGADNFKITGLRLNEEFIKSVVQIKKAAAITNLEIGELEVNIGKAIIKACDEVIAEKFNEDFIIDPIQGGAGTSINMNANEVIANRAIEILGYEKGNYRIVHPNDHVNMGQSTNDVIPTAGKITALRLVIKNLDKLKELSNAFSEKAEQFKDVIKMGRTQLQDAVPITLGQEFSAYSAVVKRDIARIQKAQDELKVVNIGGTAVGTGINADSRYVDRIVPRLSFVSGLNLKKADDLIDGTQNLDSFASLSATIKTCALNLSKIANDLRLMSSGPRTGLGEINLPAKQNGSSIMPGKVNPVIPEVINQIAFNIAGNDVAISMAVEAGQLELNAFEPVIFYNIFESIQTLTNGVDTFIKNCILDITANEEICSEYVNNSVGIVTALCPYIGYAESAKIAKMAIKSGESIKKVVLREGVLKEKELNSIINPLKMTKPGIVGK